MIEVSWLKYPLDAINRACHFSSHVRQNSFIPTVDFDRLSAGRDMARAFLCLRQLVPEYARDAAGAEGSQRVIARKVRKDRTPPRNKTRGGVFDY